MDEGRGGQNLKAKRLKKGVTWQIEVKNPEKHQSREFNTQDHLNKDKKRRKKKKNLKRGKGDLGDSKKKQGIITRNHRRVGEGGVMAGKHKL